MNGSDEQLSEAVECRGHLVVGLAQPCLAQDAEGALQVGEVEADEQAEPQRRAQTDGEVEERMQQPLPPLGAAGAGRGAELAADELSGRVAAPPLPEQLRRFR